MSNHDKVYGICESKCFVETMSKDEMIRRMVLISTGEEPKTDFTEYYRSRTEETLPYVETRFATNMTGMFTNCKNIRSIPDLDTSNVTDMAFMFWDCENLISIPDLNASKVTDMSRMFQSCISLSSIPDLDVANLTTFNFMFVDCNSLTTLRDNHFAPEGHRWQFKDDVDFGDCRLDRTSILKVFNGLQVVEGKTITISSLTNSYLSDEDKQIAINKGWTISVK